MWWNPGCDRGFLFLHSHLQPQMWQTSRHPSFSSLFSFVYMRACVCDWNSVTLSAVQCSSSCDSHETAQLYLFPFSLSLSLSVSLSVSLSLSLSLLLSHSFTSLLCEHRGPGALPCSPSNNGMQTAGQLNPGLTLTAELSTQEGGRRNTTSQREGGVWLIMRNHVLFSSDGKPEGVREAKKIKKGMVRRRPFGEDVTKVWVPCTTVRKYLVKWDLSPWDTAIMTQLFLPLVHICIFHRECKDKCRHAKKTQYVYVDHHICLSLSSENVDNTCASQHIKCHARED